MVHETAGRLAASSGFHWAPVKAAQMALQMAATMATVTVVAWVAVMDT
jgi:hypothetical protein